MTKEAGCTAAKRKLLATATASFIAWTSCIAPAAPVMAMSMLSARLPLHAQMAIMHGSSGGGNTYNVLSSNLNYSPVPTVNANCTAPSATTTYYFDSTKGTEGDGSSGNAFRSLPQAMADKEFAEDPGSTGGPQLIHSPAILKIRNAQGATTNFGNNWSNAGWFMIETDSNTGGTLGAFTTSHVNKLAIISNIVTGTWSNSSEDPLIYVSSGSHSADVYIFGNTIYSDTLANLKAQTTSNPGVAGDTGVTWWATHIASGIKIIGSNDTCVTIQNNNISGVAYGIVTGDTGGSSDPLYTTIAGNIINWFAEDGIDWDDSHGLIANNQITNPVRINNGHADCIQRQPNFTDSTDVIIAGNVCIRRIKLQVVDPDNPYPGGWQGIDAFDGYETVLQILNNLVVASEQAGIAFYGVNGLQLTGNKVGSDDGTGLDVPSSCSPTCTPAQIETQYTTVGYTNLNQAAGQYVYIFIRSSKTSVSSNNVTLTGNFSNAFYVAPDTTSVTASGNFGWLTPNGSTNIHVEFGGSTFTTVGTHGGYFIEGKAAGGSGASGIAYSTCAGTYCLPDEVDLNSYGSTGPSYGYNVKLKGT